MINFFFVILLSVSSFAEDLSSWKTFCRQMEWDKIPIRKNGMVLSVDAYSKELIKSIFSENPCQSIALSAPSTYCFLSLNGDKANDCKIRIKIEHGDLQNKIGTKLNTLSLTDLLKKKDLLLSEHSRLLKEDREQTTYAKAVAEVLEKTLKTESVLSGHDWTLKGASDWMTLREVRNRSLVELKKLFENSPKNLNTQEKDQFFWMSVYTKLKPFQWALLLTILGFLSSLVNKAHWSLLFGVLVLEGVALILRALITGRAPVTNMFETVCWVGLGSIILGAVFARKFKKRELEGLGFLGNGLALFMMNFSDRMLNESLEPLVPVLRDNFWLSTHVTMVTFSYACFATAWLVSNWILLREVIRPNTHSFLKEWTPPTRLLIQVGTVFLATGIILGGIWADYSWGRFWGWDPKETWSLIALLIYIALLHGQFAGWFRGIGFMIYSSAAFLAILMTWFGVNYLLTVGLHSYGFSSGGTVFLVTIFLLQIFLFVLVWIQRKKRFNQNSNKI